MFGLGGGDPFGGLASDIGLTDVAGGLSGFDIPKAPDVGGMIEDALDPLIAPLEAIGGFFTDPWGAIGDGAGEMAGFFLEDIFGPAFVEPAAKLIEGLAGGVQPRSYALRPEDYALRDKFSPTFGRVDALRSNPPMSSPSAPTDVLALGGNPAQDASQYMGGRAKGLLSQAAAAMPAWQNLYNTGNRFENLAAQTGAINPYGATDPTKNNAGNLLSFLQGFGSMVPNTPA